MALRFNNNFFHKCFILIIYENKIIEEDKHERQYFRINYRMYLNLKNVSFFVVMK